MGVGVAIATPRVGLVRGRSTGPMRSSVNPLAPIDRAAASPLVVAVDGPSGSGKSTVSRAVARRLGLRYLDTGAMYRAVTWAVLAAGVDPRDAAGVAAVATRVGLAVGTDPGSPAISADGVDVRVEIRSRTVSASVSAVSAVPAVRTQLVAQQRQIIGAGGIVVEGRDIGTVVAPDAPVKIYLTAEGSARAQRRAQDREYAGAALAAPDVVAAAQADLTRRDRLDSGRATSPLARAEDAVELDSTHLGVEEVVEAVLTRCAEAAGALLPHSAASSSRQ
jgi:cytidylate kinase